jgi:hypothetical protein
MATTRFPAEQNPAVDPELPQPAGPQEIQNPAPANVPVQESLAPNEELINTFAPAPQQVATPLLTPAESIARAQSSPPPVDAATFNANTNTSVLTAIGAQPAPVQAGPSSGYTTSASQNFAQQFANSESAQQQATLLRAREQKAIQDQFQAPADGDWRVRLKLAPEATYLYRDSSNELLAPLAASNGVVFPYMPSIQMSYNADYSDAALTHSNYKGYFYNSSYVGDVQLSAIFTAQDTREANYLLAVIHFFRSVTKMFYGQDPQRGAPPPLVYIQGLGEYQFNNQPCVVKTFTYSLPNDVDYIRTKPNNYNINLNNRLPKSQTAPSNSIASVVNRLRNALLPRGALPNTGPQSLTVEQSVTNVANSTYVPTRIEIQLTLMPIQTRSQQSQQFSVRDFGNGKLLRGGFW